MITDHSKILQIQRNQPQAFEKRIAKRLGETLPRKTTDTLNLAGLALNSCTGHDVNKIQRVEHSEKLSDCNCSSVSYLCWPYPAYQKFPVFFCRPTELKILRAIEFHTASDPEFFSLFLFLFFITDYNAKDF